MEVKVSRMRKQFFQRFLLIVLFLTIVAVTNYLTPFLTSDALTKHSTKIYIITTFLLLLFLCFPLLTAPTETLDLTLGQKVIVTLFSILICAASSTVFLHTIPYFFTLFVHTESTSIFEVDGVYYQHRNRRFGCPQALEIESQPIWGTRLCVDYATSKIVDEALTQRIQTSCEILVTGKSSWFGMIPASVSLSDPGINRPCYVFRRN